MPKLGPTGDFPRGKLGPTDEGGLAIGVSKDEKGNVVINFGTPVRWVGIPPEQVATFCRLLLRHAGAKKVEISF